MPQERGGPQLATAPPEPAAVGIQNCSEREVLHGILDPISHPAALTLLLVDDDAWPGAKERPQATEFHWRIHGLRRCISQEVAFF